MSKIILFMSILLSFLFTLAVADDRLTVVFSGTRFEVPKEIQAIGSNAHDDHFLILKYSLESGKQYIGFWDETNNPMYTDLQCDKSAFFDSVFLQSKTECNSESKTIFYEAFIKDSTTGILKAGGKTYYYSEDRRAVNVFFISDNNRLIHLDSDFLSRKQLIELRIN